MSVDALLREAGVIRADGLSDLLGVSSLLAKQPLPAGPRVGIVTNAGGPGIMCADACEAARLEVPGLGEAVRARLAEVLPDEAALANPVDMLATATPDQYRAVIDAVAESGEVDALIVIFIEPLLIRSGDVVAAVEGAIVDDCPLPVLNVLMSEPHSSPAALAPSFRYPESAVTALAGAVHYARWREQPERPMPRLDDVDPIAAGAAIAAALDAGEDWMAPEHLSLLLDAYRVPQVASQLARDADDAASAAAVIGYPVALKAVAPGIVHKSDIGAVRLGVDRDAELRRDVDEIRAVVDAHGAELEGVLVQAMAPAGPELIVGVTNDPMFGPLIVCGAGGVEAELINDIAIRLGPVAHSEALEMLTELATYPRLTGYRGAAPVDLDALADLIVRISVMADAHEEIRELDLNPVIAATAGATAVDARVRVEPAAPRRPWPST